MPPGPQRDLAAYALSGKGGPFLKAQYHLPFTLDVVCSRCEENPVPTP